MDEKSLRYWFWWPIRTYDTFEADTPPVMQLARNIYATLVSDFIDGKAQGILAKEWQVSNDGKTWRFILRTDLKFDDGSPITPEIVLLNFKRILWLTRSEGLALNSLLPEVSKWKSMNEASKAIILENQNELVFRFVKRPIGLFEAISQPIYGIAHPKCFDGNGIWKDALSTVSSGQYSITGRGANFISLKTRKVFPSVTNAPSLVQIMWPASTTDSVVKAIEEQRGDLTVEHSFALGRETLEKLNSTGIKSTSEPTVRMHFMHLNHKRPALANKKTRQAIRDTFLANLRSSADFRTSGVEVDSSFIPKGGVGYRTFPSRDGAATAPKKSLGKLEVLFYPFSADPKIQGSVESAVIESLKKTGFEPAITRYPERFAAFNRMRAGNFDVIIRGTGILVKNPYGDLRMMFMSTVGARIPDPTGKIPSLIEQAEEEQDGSKRGDLVSQINTLIHEEAAIITFAHSGLLYLHRGKIDFSHYNLFSDPIEFRAIGWTP